MCIHAFSSFPAKHQYLEQPLMFLLYINHAYSDIISSEPSLPGYLKCINTFFFPKLEATLWVIKANRKNYIWLLVFSLLYSNVHCIYHQTQGVSKKTCALHFRKHAYLIQFQLKTDNRKRQLKKLIKNIG